MPRLDETLLLEGVSSPSQPEQLAAIGTLFGLAPALPSHSRVLELGCSAGGNLIPLASRYPNAVFLGVDPRKEYVEMGRQTIQALGLKNIKLYEADFTALRPSKQKFDYIICHDRYSRATASAQDAILKLINENLAEQGVAYVSYHVYPGWKQREVVRDAMTFQIDKIDQPAQKLDKAREVFALLHNASDASSGFGQVLRDHAKIVSEAPDRTFFREYFDEEIRPCYFREFIASAQEYQLGFLGEARITDIVLRGFDDRVVDALKKLSGGNILETQQYLDFFNNRSFRQTLLIHRAAMKRVKRTVSLLSLRPFLFSSALAPTRQALIETQEEMEFRDSAGRSVKLDSPLLKAMLMTFFESYPRALALEDLLEGIRNRLGRNFVLADAESKKIGDVLLSFTLDGAVFLHPEPTARSNFDPSMPMAFSPARYLASKNVLTVLNQRHEIVELSEIDAQILALLDGKTQIDELARALVESTVQGTLTLMRDNIRLSDATEIFPIVEKLLAESLKKFRRLALLIL